MQCFDGAFDETRNPTMSVLTGFLCVRVQINFGTVEEVETTHDGFRPHTLFTAVIQNSVQKVPRVIRT